MTPDIVIYHGGCPDGLTSAWIFDTKYPGVTRLGYKHGQVPPDVKDKVVVIVDFSFSRPIMQQMIADAKYLVVLDHHISAQKDLDNLDMCGKGQMIFDMSRCGAQLAWDYVYPGVNRPWIVEYVADRDLWTNKLAYTKEVSQYLNFHDVFSDFAVLTSLSTSVTSDKVFTDIVTEGSILLKLENKKIDYYVKTSSIMNFKCGTKVYKVRVACVPREYRSDVGNQMCLLGDCDFAVLYWYDVTIDEWWISLRANNTYDVSEIASGFKNGGGHKNAAGFTLKGNLCDYFSRPLLE